MYAKATDNYNVIFSDSHHTFICWNAARLGGKPDVFELDLKYDNKPFYPQHNRCSMDVRINILVIRWDLRLHQGNIVALSSGEIVLVFLYNVEKAPKQLCELNIKGGSVFKAWHLGTFWNISRDIILK